MKASMQMRPCFSSACEGVHWRFHSRRDCTGIKAPRGRARRAIALELAVPPRAMVPRVPAARVGGGNQTGTAVPYENKGRQGAGQGGEGRSHLTQVLHVETAAQVHRVEALFMSGGGRGPAAPVDRRLPWRAAAWVPWQLGMRAGRRTLSPAMEPSR